MKKISYIIHCPKCDAEYLPSEIFYPKHYFGDVSNIVKDKCGKIISYYGEQMNLSETYICDYCGQHINVLSKVQFTPDIEVDFSEDYVQSINNKMVLAEE